MNMSGPKCDSYYVDDGANELLLQAQRAEAERVARLARERLETALASGRKAQEKLAAMIETGRGVEKQYSASIDILRQELPGFPGRNSSVDEIERYISNVERAVASITAEIGRAEGLAQLRSLVAASTTVTQVADWTEELQRRQHPAGSKSADAQGTSREKREELTGRIVRRLQGAANAEELRSIEMMVKEIVSTTSAGRAEALETELRLRIQRVNERLQRRQQDAVEAGKLLAGLRGFQGSEVELMREELQAVAGDHRTLSRDIAERANEVRARALKRINDEYAGKVIREELQRLGYSVGEEFSTLFVSGGQAVVSRPEEPEYSVQMQIDASKGLLDLAVVRSSESNELGPAERQLRDKNAEERWCADHDRLRSAMRARGLGGRVIKHLPPGAQPVPITKSMRGQEARRPETLKQRELR
jgi:hypothetical protein